MVACRDFSRSSLLVSVNRSTCIMNWSIERRFRKGLFLTPELLGYDRDEEGDLIVNDDEAETVKAIYYLYLILLSI